MSNIKQQMQLRDDQNKKTKIKTKAKKNKKDERKISTWAVLPGGKALETEGLREASSVGRGQGPGSGYKG